MASVAKSVSVARGDGPLGSDLSWEEWADAFALRLAARAQAAEAARRLPQESVEEAEAAGFFALLAPKAVGGYGGSFFQFMDLTRRLSQGCTASGWTLSFLGLHAWMLAKLGAEAQALLFADGQMPRAPAPLAPTGTATPVEGGYRLNGRWEWATGVYHSNWLMVHCIEQGSRDSRFCVVPVDAAQVEDVWHVAGMAATGSQTVRLEDVFCPSFMTLTARQMAAGASPGEALHPGTTLAYPLRVGLGLVAATPALGAAEAAVAYYRTRMAGKVQAYSDGQLQKDMQSTHLRLGESIADVQAARLVWEEAGRLLDREGPKGRAIAQDVLVRLRLAGAQIVRLSCQAIDRLAGSAGAGAAMLHAPLQRQLRDVQVMRGHVMFDWDRAAIIAGKVALGYETGPADLV